VLRMPFSGLRILAVAGSGSGLISNVAGPIKGTLHPVVF